MMFDIFLRGFTRKERLPFTPAKKNLILSENSQNITESRHFEHFCELFFQKFCIKFNG